MACELVEVNYGADGQPESPQAIQINRGFDSLTDVAGRLAVPHDVGEVSRRVIEGSGPNARIVRAGDECVARTKTGSDHAQLLVSLLLQPIEAAANVNHPLTDGIERASDVR